MDRMKFFNRLGTIVEQRWKAKNFDTNAFAPIAFQALQQFPPSEFITYEQIIKWTLESDLPAQADSGFGQPPLIVFRHPSFFIQALFWLEGTTSIHQHAFSGAFHLLSGSSIHSSFKFDLQERITPSFLLGDLKLKRTEYLSQGDTRKIASGPNFIHSVFHLDQPSVTIVVRTFKDQKSLPQYDYLKPCLAYDPFSGTPLMQRRLQLLDVLSRSQHHDLRQMTSDFLSSADIESVFRILERLYRNLSDAEYSFLSALARKKHGAIVDKFTKVYEERACDIDVAERRRSLTNPEHRFFLALLMNFRNRNQIYRFVRKRYPDDPAKRVAHWTKELASEQPKQTPNGNRLQVRLETLLQLNRQDAKFAKVRE